MRFHIHGTIHLHLDGPITIITKDDGENNEVLEKLNLIIEQNKKIMSTQAEIAEQLNQTTDQLQKIGNESAATLQKVKELEEALANQSNVTPELQAAFDALKAQVQTVDDLVPDAV